jgi:membrane protein
MAIVLDRLPAWRIGNTDVTDVAKETVREVQDDDVAGLAAEMAYHSILSIFPFLLFLAGVTSIIDNVFGVGDLTARVIDKAAQVMPGDAVSVLESFTTEVVESDGGGAMAFGLAASFWAASSAVGAAIKGLNRAYDVEDDRGFVRKKASALAITLVFFGLLLSAAIVLGTGRFMAREIGEIIRSEGVFVAMYEWASIPGALALVALAVATIYAFGPNTRHEWRWISPGAVLFVVAWAVGSLLFAYYVSRFGAYNRTYGSIGAVILLLVYLYWTNFVLLVGGELNSVLAARADPEYKRSPTRRKRGRGSPANP